MSAETTHLHPVRPEYLRRGTPVIHLGHGCVVTDPDPLGDTLDVRICQGPGMIGIGDSVGAAIEDLALDLRDPTARAHAAMAYTALGCGPTGGVEVQPRDPLRHAASALYEARGASNEHADALLWMDTLCRMRALDETVTPAEARAALLWADA